MGSVKHGLIYKQPRQVLGLCGFHSRDIRKNGSSPKWKGLSVWGRHVGQCPSKGHQHGGREVTNICHRVKQCKWKVITLRLRHVEINTSSNLRALQLSFDLQLSRADILISRHAKSSEIHIRVLKNWKTLLSFVKRHVLRGSFIWWN